VEAEHQLIVTYEVTNVGNDGAQLAPMAKAAQRTLGAQDLHVIADRGCFDEDQIRECVEAGLTVTLPKPQTSGAKAEDRFGKQDSPICPSRTPIAARPASSSGALPARVRPRETTSRGGYRFFSPHDNNRAI
jgi:hypothetical protein